MRPPSTRTRLREVAAACPTQAIVLEEVIESLSGGLTG